MGPLCALLIWVTPIESLTPEQHRLLAVMALVAIWWITEPVAIPVTSLLGPTLCVLVGVAPMKTAFDSFANPMIFLFMGGFLIAKGMMVTYCLRHHVDEGGGRFAAAYLYCHGTGVYDLQRMDQ